MKSALSIQTLLCDNEYCYTFYSELQFNNTLCSVNILTMVTRISHSLTLPYVTYTFVYVTFRGMAWGGLMFKELRYYSDVPGIDSRWSHWIFSDRTTALGSTQSLVKMSTTNISWGHRRPVSEADNLTTFMLRMSWKSGSLNLPGTLWATPGLLRD